MKKYKVVLVVTVGGSLFYNFKKFLENPIAQRKIIGVKTILDKLLSDGKLTDTDKKVLVEKIPFFFNRASRELKSGEIAWDFTSTTQANKEASAELQSIAQWIEERGTKNEELYIRLLSTNTDLSVQAGNFIKQKLLEWYPMIFLKEDQIVGIEVKGLKITKSDRLNERGLLNLVGEIHNVKNKLLPSKQSGEMLINITGGYKGVIPILSLVAQVLNCQLLYSYEYRHENTNEENILLPGHLLAIPPFNVHFLWDFTENYLPLMERVIRSNDKHQSIQLTKHEEEVIEQELIHAKFCEFHRNGGYQVTPIGRLMMKMLEQRTPMGKSVLGYFLEAKVFEYLLTENWADYHQVKHSHYLKPMAETERVQEVDIYLENDYENWIWCEVKSYARILNPRSRKDKPKFLTQLDNQLKGIPLSGKRWPTEYHLYLYKRPFHNMEDNYLKKYLQMIQEKLVAEGIPTFRIFYIELDLSLSDFQEETYNPYTEKLMPRKLTRNETIFRKTQASNHKYDQYLLVKEYHLPRH